MEGDTSGTANDVYKECLRNHAATLGSYATDGCGEFTPDDTRPDGALQCAACGCHRNFHRKVTYSGGGGGSPTSGIMPMSTTSTNPESSEAEGGGRKRFRTKFTAEQKEKMLAFAEKLGWKMKRKEEEDEIEQFCRSVGVSRQVFKVWMHNHKNSSPSNSSSSATSAANASNSPPFHHAI